MARKKGGKKLEKQPNYWLRGIIAGIALVVLSVGGLLGYRYWEEAEYQRLHPDEIHFIKLPN